MNETWKFAGFSVAFAGLTALSALALAAPTPPPPVRMRTNPDLTPHRAIYDMTLLKAAAGANVGEVRGRLVFDFSGSGCEGYTLNTRLVTEIVDRDGQATVTDLRSSTWEQAGGDKFRFNSSQYLNQQLSEQVVGLASRGKDGGNVNVALEKPRKQQVKIAAGSMFPTQHSLAIIEAAREGRGVVQANIYDGSEKGEKYYETTTFIGKPVVAVRKTEDKPLQNAEKLDGLTSWPVSISYFETNPGVKTREEGTPSYELSFQLYANGVSSNLRIDYGTFAIAGEMTRIDFLEPGKCPEEKPDASGKAEKKR